MTFQIGLWKVELALLRPEQRKSARAVAEMEQSVLYPLSDLPPAQSCRLQWIETSIPRGYKCRCPEKPSA